MKRRGFLGSLVSIVAASALPKAEEVKPLIRMKTLPPDSVAFIKGKSKFMASGWIDEGAERYWKEAGHQETVGDFWKRELDKER